MDLGFVLAIILALVQTITIDIEGLTLIPRQKWFSFAGGVAIAYVVLDIIPRLGSIQGDLQGGNTDFWVNTNSNFYLLILVGITLFYGLEKLSLRSNSFNPSMALSNLTSLGIFVVQIAAFSSYNLIFVGLLNSYAFEYGIIERFLLFVVLILHFIVNDYNLSERYKESYRKIGRWFLVIATILGSLMNTSLFYEELTASFLWAFVAGGMISNVLKEELPGKQTSSFWSFSLGALIYSILLVLL